MIIFNLTAMDLAFAQSAGNQALAQAMVGTWAIGGFERCAAAPWRVTQSGSEISFVDSAGKITREVIEENSSDYLRARVAESKGVPVGTVFRYRRSEPGVVLVENITSGRSFKLFKCDSSDGSASILPRGDAAGHSRSSATEIARSAGSLSQASRRSFRDCLGCPEMMPVQAGAELSTSGRRIEVSRNFSVGKYEVTIQEWRACLEDGGCPLVPWHRQPLRAGSRLHLDQPVVNVSWVDALAYVEWLSEKTGKTYRLLTESEWEYLAQAGAGENRPRRGESMANCKDCGSPWSGEQTARVGSFAANKFGIHDMLGNVWEWVSDCWAKERSNGRVENRVDNECEERVIRGGSYSDDSSVVSSSIRQSLAPEERFINIGFRVARDD